MKSKQICTLGALVLYCSATFACGNDSGATCGEGTELVGGNCLPTDAGASAAADSGPDSSVSCGPHTFMLNGKCQGILPVGAACERGSQCESETCAQMTEGFPGGYCTVPSCNDKRPCPTGSHCYFSSARARSICLAFCDPDQAVRSDNPYVCQPIIGTDLNLLTPSCNTVNSCPDQTTCDKISGQCVLRECDSHANDPCDTANSKRICYPDRKNLTKLGGLCLSQCDPKAASCQAGDHCQPLPEDPANSGVCVPPVCSASADCPVGSVCKDAICQPPLRCDGQGKCADDTTDCVGGAGGQCMPKCPSGAAKCSDVHAGLVCAQGVATTPVCLPEGSFPGSTCRSGASSACDSVKVGSNSAKMVCENNSCLVECGTGGDALCKGVKNTLSCASGIYEQPVCLPNGAYPGGPCDAANSCQDVNLAAGVSAKQLCKGKLCVFDCAASTTGNDDGAAYCAGIDASLTCSSAAYPGSSVCLPEGTYPGSPCAHGSCGKLGDTQLVCENNLCLLTCSMSNDTCGSVDASLVCAHEIYDQDVCLPKGAFPGAPCGGANHDQCAQDLNGMDEIDMQCVQGTCAVGCSETGKWAGYGEAVCHFTDPSLTCAQAAGSVCVKACESGVCASGYSCLDPGALPAHENACLPDGSFPGAACATGDSCGAGPGGSTMSCHSGTCIVNCPAGGAGDALCAGINSALTCSDASGGLCLPACNVAYGSTKCPNGLSCLASENACLPDGSFPGAACAPGDACGAGPGGSTMSCHTGSCIVNCPAAGAGDTLCSSVSAALTCSDASGGLCLPACNVTYGPSKCPTGLSCFASENACLPNGSFPGAACATGDSCADGPQGSTMSCHSGSCVVECPSGSAGDTLCSSISAALTCSDAASGLCLPACDMAYGPTKCPNGLSCLASENACLPNGSFLGAACAVGDVCSGSPLLVCVPGGGTPTCGAGCSIGSGQVAADAYCTGVGDAFPGSDLSTCSDVGDGLHVCTP